MISEGDPGNVRSNPATFLLGFRSNIMPHTVANIAGQAYPRCLPPFSGMFVVLHPTLAERPKPHNMGGSQLPCWEASEIHRGTGCIYMYASALPNPSRKQSISDFLPGRSTKCLKAMAQTTLQIEGNKSKPCKSDIDF